MEKTCLLSVKQLLFKMLYRCCALNRKKHVYVPRTIAAKNVDILCFELEKPCGCNGCNGTIAVENVASSGLKIEKPFLKL